MAIPLGVYAALSLGIGTGGTLAYLVKRVDGRIEEVQEDFWNNLREEGVPFVSDLASEVGGLTLDLVKGFGSAVIESIDNAYDALRDKLRGKEPDVIAAIVIGFGAVFAGVYIYQSFKNSNDAFN